MAGIEEAFENFVKRVSSQEEPQSEYGEPQTGDKRIPIYQNINPGYDVYESMPTRGGNSFQQDLAYGGRAGYFLGGAIKKAIGEIAEKLPPEQQEAIVKTNQSGGGLGSIFRRIISRVADVVKNKSTATPAAGLAISLDRPVQSGDPIGSYYANPNNPALASVAPPTTNPLTRPLSMAGFYGSEIFDIY